MIPWSVHKSSVRYEIQPPIHVFGSTYFNIGSHENSTRYLLHCSKEEVEIPLALLQQLTIFVHSTTWYGNVYQASWWPFGDATRNRLNSKILIKVPEPRPRDLRAQISKCGLYSKDFRPNNLSSAQIWSRTYLNGSLVVDVKPLSSLWGNANVWKRPPSDCQW